MNHSKERYLNHHRKEEKTKGERKKKEAFSYLLTTYLLAHSTARTKYLFRNYLIDSSAAFVEIPSELNPVVTYDNMDVILSVPSQPTWEDLFKIIIKLDKLKQSTETIIVFNNYVLVE